ncbi:hypothetical protein GOODEAATRI_011935 [Goodea atripinnis]|uniref:Uncharacterized protein n=1 Tax=Goodea atripinnis TaxID=208336 RepID=A0ABV0MH22_9TELE
MGSGVNSNTTGVSSPPADHQSASSQPPFSNMPQVRSQTLTCPVAAACCIITLPVTCPTRLFTNSIYLAQQSPSGAAASNSLSTSISEAPKATFPAYTQPSVSSSTSNPSSSTVAKPPATVTSKPATLTTTSATSKLIHPDEDISLVSCLIFLLCSFSQARQHWYPIPQPFCECLFVLKEACHSFSSLNVCVLCFLCNQEEMKAQLPRYQRLIPRAGQAHAAAAPPVAAVGSIMPPQQGLPPQQPGMRHPMHGQYGAPPQGMPGYMPGGMPPYGQGPPMVPPYQGGPPMGMRPPVMSPAGRY